MNYYDKDGSPLSHSEWLAKQQQADYRTIFMAKVPNGAAVATVWLGVDTNPLGDGPPLIFETAILDPDGLIFAGRYSTLADAETGHQETLLNEMR